MSALKRVLLFVAQLVVTVLLIATFPIWVGLIFYYLRTTED